MIQTTSHSIRILTCLIVAIATFAVVGSSSVATDYYVDNVGGDDRNTGAAPANKGTGHAPFRTIARALRAVDGGDRVILTKNAEPYRESITLEGSKCSGNQARRFELIGNGATLDGTALISGEVWNHYSGNVFKFRPRRPTHQMLYMDDKPMSRNRTPNAKTLAPLEWTLIDGEVYFCVEEGKLPVDYTVSMCKHRVGITLYEVRDVIISGLTIQGFQLDGVNAHGLVSNAELHSSTLRGNGRSGLSVGGASRFEMNSCLLGNNGVAQMRLEGYCRVATSDCDLVEDDHALRIDLDGGRLVRAGEPVDTDLR